ncbi:Repeat domain-containing protein [Azospirillaceae bacterium]
MFLDCTHLLAETPAYPSFGAAVCDIDGDGAFEIIVTGHGAPNRALKWNKGRLVNCTPTPLTDPSGFALAVAAADIDGDGREELYIVNGEKDSNIRKQSDRLFASFGQRWLDLLAQPENNKVVSPYVGRTVACLDRFGRGRYGFAVANNRAPITLYELDAHGQLSDVSEDAGIDLIAVGSACAALPLISDHMDLFVSNEHGPNFLFRNLGDGTFEDVAERWPLADARQAGRGIAVVDAPYDGRFALLCGNWEGSHRLFTQRGGSFIDIAPSDLSLPSRVNAVIAADFDNDGYEELFFHNFGQPNRLFGWRHDQWQEIEIGDAAEPRNHGVGAVACDIDGDGRLELLLCHNESTSHSVSVYRTPQNNNAWVRVMPLTAAGAPARGAIVTCIAGGRTQRRAICAGGGYLSQMEPTAHFGLGHVTNVEKIVIFWPNGTEVVINDPPVGRVLTVPYPPE